MQYGTTGDEFKPLSEAQLPDIRQKAFARLLPDGNFRAVNINDLHDRIAKIELNSAVPEDIRTGFNTARNLYVYSWFVYRFLPVAEFQAYAVLEYALGKRIEREKIINARGFNNRFAIAIRRGWFRAEEIRRYKQSAIRRKDYSQTWEEMFKNHEGNNPVCQTAKTATEDQHASAYLSNLQKGMPLLRNAIAHGEPYLGGGTVVTIEICCDLINQLFPAPIPPVN